MPLKLSYDDPVTAVFLRMLAWELYVAEGQPRVKDAKELVQIAREDLGLARLLGGAADAFIQGLRPQKLLSAKTQPPKPLQPQWPTEWRLLYLPPHDLVRQLSDNPVVQLQEPKVKPQNYLEISLTLRDPAIPALRVFVGKGQPKTNPFGRLRGTYFLRLPQDPQLPQRLYLGKTDEFDVRLRQQIKNRKPSWWVFVTPKDSTQMFTLDALAAAEALLISFWGETSVLDNGTRGGDQEPASIFLQQAVLFAEAASATLLWLVREQNSIALPNGISLKIPLELEIPFKPWRGQGWPDCYVKI